MITKEAQNKQNYIKNKKYFNSARNAFQFLLENIINSNQDIILMPEYIGQSPREGSGVFDPIRKTNTNYKFYALDEKLQVDIKDLISKITKNVKAILLIHYFGFPQKEIRKLKEICDKNKIILIEDCAHTMTSCINNQQLGSIGDFSFYSTHKLLPSKNGGILQINNEKIELENQKSNFIDNEDLNILLNADLDKISAKRVANYKYYQKLCNNTSSIYESMYESLDTGVVPLNYPVLIKNISREKLYFELINRGIVTVALYYQLIDELDKKEHKKAFYTSEHILNLPLHQDIEFEDIECIMKEIDKIEKEIKRGELKL